MGEKHLPEALIDLLFPDEKRSRHVFQGKALEHAAPFLLYGKGNQRGLAENDGVAQLFRHAKAVSGGARSRIGKAAGAEDHRVRRESAPGIQAHAADRGSVRQDLFYRRPQADLYAQPFQLIRQRTDDVRGMVGNRENPVSPLRFQGAAPLLKKILYSRIVKPVNGAVQEPGIADHAVEQLLHVAGVCQIAAALSRDVDFLPKLFILLKKEHRMPLPGCGCGRHHARGPAADYDHSAHVPSLFRYSSSSALSVRCARRRTAPLAASTPESVNRESSSIRSISSCMDTW